MVTNIDYYNPSLVKATHMPYGANSTLVLAVSKLHHCTTVNVLNE